MCTWVNPGFTPGTSVTRSIMGVFGGTGATRMKLSVLAAGTLELRARALDSDAASALTVSVVTLMPAGVWTHVVGVVDYNRALGSIYINGNLTAAADFSATMTKGNTSNTACTNGCIGANEPGTTNFWLGLNEDARIYGRAMGDTDISTIFATRGNDRHLDQIEGRWFLREKGPGQAMDLASDLSINQFSGFPTAVTYDNGTCVPRKRKQVSIGF